MPVASRAGHQQESSRAGRRPVKILAFVRRSSCASTAAFLRRRPLPGIDSAVEPAPPRARAAQGGRQRTRSLSNSANLFWRATRAPTCSPTTCPGAWATRTRAFQGRSACKCKWPAAAAPVRQRASSGTRAGSVSTGLSHGGQSPVGQAQSTHTHTRTHSHQPV